MRPRGWNVGAIVRCEVDNLDNDVVSIVISGGSNGGGFNTMAMQLRREGGNLEIQLASSTEMLEAARKLIEAENSQQSP